jgi:hypothetical protein
VARARRRRPAEAEPPRDELSEELRDDIERAWQWWRPRVGIWAGRFALIGLGFVLGVELGRGWGPVAVGVFALVVAALGAISSLINVDRELAPEIDEHKEREVSARADSLVRSAGERAAEVRRAAELEAEETLTAAQLEAKLIIERARTAAIALDRTHHKQDRS